MSDSPARTKDPKALVAEVLAANRRAVARVHDDLQHGARTFESRPGNLVGRVSRRGATDPFDRLLRSSGGF